MYENNSPLGGCWTVQLGAVEGNNYCPLCMHAEHVHEIILWAVFLISTFYYISCAVKLINFFLKLRVHLFEYCLLSVGGCRLL